MGIADGPDPDQGILLEGIGVEGDQDGLPVVDQVLAVGEEGQDGLLLGIFGEHGERVYDCNLGFTGPDMVDDPLQDPVHLFLRPLEPHHVEVEEPHVSPGEVVGNVQAHGLHLGEETLCGHLGGVEVDIQPLLHRPPHDLLGEDALPRIVLPFDQGEGTERKTIGYFLIDLPVSCRKDVFVLATKEP